MNIIHKLYRSNISIANTVFTSSTAVKELGLLFIRSAILHLQGPVIFHNISHVNCVVSSDAPIPILVLIRLHFGGIGLALVKPSLCINNFTADDINNYFLSVPYNTVHSVSSISVSPLSYLHDACDTTFQISSVDLDDTVSVLSNLDSAKATGCDFQ